MDMWRRVGSLITAFLYSNLFIGAAAAGLTAATVRIVDSDVSGDWVTPAFVFFSTLIVYNLDRLVGASDAEDAVDATVRHDWIDRADGVLWGVVAVSTVIVLVLVWWLPVRALWVLVPMGVLAVGYAVPLTLPGLGRARLKEISGLKMALIVCVWVGATVLLPAVIVERLGTGQTWAVAGLRGLLIFGLTLPFDLRDVERDRQAGIHTIPHLLGPRNTKRLAMVAVSVFGVAGVSVFGVSVGQPGVCYAMTAVLSLPVLMYAEVDRPEWYFVGLVDGMLVVHAALIWVWLA